MTCPASLGVAPGAEGDAALGGAPNIPGDAVCPDCAAAGAPLVALVVPELTAVDAALTPVAVACVADDNAVVAPCRPNDIAEALTPAATASAGLAIPGISGRGIANELTRLVMP